MTDTSMGIDQTLRSDLNAGTSTEIPNSLNLPQSATSTNSVSSVSNASFNFYFSVFLAVILKNGFNSLVNMKYTYFPPSTNPSTTVQIS